MISGADEAGRGPVLGPLVVAGVTFHDDKELIKNKIRDSKKLSPRRRNILEKFIKEIAVKYEILVIPAKDIDDMRKVMTLNEIETNAFSRVIKKLRPEICYVDSADVKEDRFRDDIMSNITFKTEIISKHKADDIYPVVGAASILAKTRRDAEVKIIAEKLEKRLRMPLGSGYPADPITRKFLYAWYDKYGSLPPHTRSSWNTAKKLIKSMSNKKLDEF